jgi:hypothetical protein
VNNRVERGTQDLQKSSRMNVEFNSESVESTPSFPSMKISTNDYVTCSVVEETQEKGEETPASLFTHESFFLASDKFSLS